MTSSIEIKNLTVSFANNTIIAVDDVSLTIKPNRVTGIVGASGSGKSILASAILHLNPKNAYTRGSILYDGVDILKLNQKQIQKIRGKEIAYIPQNPDLSLNPVLKNKIQMKELLDAHTKIPRDRKIQMITDLLTRMGLSNAEDLFEKYPFQLSGGIKQRIVSTFGVLLNSPWIIADEPTKGLDAVIRKNVFEMLAEFSVKSSMLIITHDLFFASGLCDDIAVMRDGKIIEFNNSDMIFNTPQHPYTKLLIDSIPKKCFKKDYIKKLKGKSGDLTI